MNNHPDVWSVAELSFFPVMSVQMFGHMNITRGQIYFSWLILNCFELRAELNKFPVISVQTFGHMNITRGQTAVCKVWSRI